MTIWENAKREKAWEAGEPAMLMRGNGRDTEQRDKEQKYSKGIIARIWQMQGKKWSPAYVFPRQGEKKPSI